MPHSFGSRPIFTNNLKQNGTASDFLISAGPSTSSPSDPVTRPDPLRCLHPPRYPRVRPTNRRPLSDHPPPSPPLYQPRLLCHLLVPQLYRCIAPPFNQPRPRGNPAIPPFLSPAMFSGGCSTIIGVGNFRPLKSPHEKNYGMEFYENSPLEKDSSEFPRIFII